MSKPKRYSAEVRERAVRMVREHEHEHSSQWATIVSVAEKIGCSGETLRSWVRQAERDEGRRPGLTTEERERLRELERENRELRQASTTTPPLSGWAWAASSSSTRSSSRGREGSGSRAR